VAKVSGRSVTILWGLCSLLTLAGRATSQHQHGTDGAKTQLGTVEFRVSCTSEAQNSFTRGVALLHSFTYEESAQAFRKAAASDSRCAMAHWGLAMTEYHQLWEPYAGPAELQRGASEIQKARELKPETPREKDFIEALGAFYDGWEQRGHAARAKAYQEAMRGVQVRNPKDQEAAIFYALALVATASLEDKAYEHQRTAAAILEPIFSAHPDHPGVAHYLIHAYDNPVLAPQGVAAARSYSKIAPDLPHALHMPSHIFTRLGLWEDSLSSNLAAAAAARKHGDAGEEFHALDYLVYAYLQLGRNDEAEKVRDHLPAGGDAQGSSAFKINFAKAAIRARCALEQQHWTEAENLVAEPGVQPQVAAISHWAAALGAAHRGNLPAAREHAEQVRRLSAELKEKGEEYWAQQVAIQGEEAGAWVAFAEHRTYDALRLLRMAADHEDAAEKHSVTPGAVRPARELLGDLLMEMHEPKEALRAYREVLTVAPGRRNALQGAAKAERAAGMSSKTNEMDWTRTAGEAARNGNLVPRPASGQVKLRQGWSFFTQVYGAVY
jgi:tetratricopeptide (TPR) repeat protein